MGIDVDGFSVHLVDSVENGNPLFHASETDLMLEDLRVKIMAMVVSNFGDARRME
jgi:hypothetical protein